MTPRFRTSWFGFATLLAAMSLSLLLLSSAPPERASATTCGGTGTDPAFCGTLTIVKQVTGGNDGSNWTLAVNGTAPLGPTVVQSGGSITGAVDAFETLTVSESGPAGYTTTWSCTPEGRGAGFAIVSGGDPGVDNDEDGQASFTISVNFATPFPDGATCTFVNTKTSTATSSITIIKNAVPNDTQDFAYATTGVGLSPFSLDDDADGTLPSTTTFTGLAAGAYSVTEGALPANWALTALVCTDPTLNSSGNTGTRIASINLAAGETVSCTFTNTFTPNGTPTPTPTPPPKDVPTKGDAPSGSGGQAWTRLIADLKKFPVGTPGAGTCGSAWAGYVVCSGDYDDDLDASNNFVVSPNLADDPMQHAWKVLFFDFHAKNCNPAQGICPASNDIAALQKEIFWKEAHPAQTGPGPDQNAAGQRVLHEVIEARLPNGLINPEVIITGNDCNVIGTPGAPSNSIADGLVNTGQVTAPELNDMIAKCIQIEGGFHLNNWVVTKHLPPGTYKQCVTLLHTNGAQTDSICRDFTINAIDGYVIDFANAGVAWAGLRLGNKSVHSGDFDLETENSPTIQGEGNTSLVYGVRFQTLSNALGKTIWSDFDSQINRKECPTSPPGPPDGNANCPVIPHIVEWQHIDGITSTDDPTGWSQWTIFDGPTTLAAGVTEDSGAVCLEPNEPLKLDFSVTPEQTVWAGTYGGALEIQALRDQEVCTASLDRGEESGDPGDRNVFDNNPSQGGPGPLPYVDPGTGIYPDPDWEIS